MLEGPHAVSQMLPYLCKIGPEDKRMLLCVICAINGAKLSVRKPMAQPEARPGCVTQGLVDEIFVCRWYAQNV